MLNRAPSWKATVSFVLVVPTAKVQAHPPTARRQGNSPLQKIHPLL
jgi:hypothetical protein